VAYLPGRWLANVGARRLAPTVLLALVLFAEAAGVALLAAERSWGGVIAYLPSSARPTAPWRRFRGGWSPTSSARTHTAESRRSKTCRRARRRGRAGDRRAGHRPVRLSTALGGCVVAFINGKDCCAAHPLA